MDPGTLAEFSKFNAVGERGVLSLRMIWGGGGTGGTSKPGNKAWRSESPTLPGASRNPGIPTTGFRTCFPVHRKRGGRSYARRRTRGEVVRTRRSGEAEKAEEKVAARGGGRKRRWMAEQEKEREKQEVEDDDEEDDEEEG